jgi:hypothetical protein
MPLVGVDGGKRDFDWEFVMLEDELLKRLVLCKLPVEPKKEKNRKK